jgi:hypothetical protein
MSTLVGELYETLARFDQTDDDAERDRLGRRLGKLVAVVNTTPPQSLSDCLAKLELLADPDIGMEARDRNDDMVFIATGDRFPRPDAGRRAQRVRAGRSRVTPRARARVAANRVATPNEACILQGSFPDHGGIGGDSGRSSRPNCGPLVRPFQCSMMAGSFKAIHWLTARRSAVDSRPATRCGCGRTPTTARSPGSIRMP